MGEGDKMIENTLNKIIEANEKFNFLIPRELAELEGMIRLSIGK